MNKKTRNTVSDIREDISLIKNVIAELHETVDSLLTHDKVKKSPLYYVRMELTDNIYRLEDELKDVYKRHFKRINGIRISDKRYNVLESYDEDLQ